MKNYNRVNFKSIFLWVITFALTLVVSMGGAFAYFTATAKNQQSNITTAIIKVGISNTKLTASGQTSALATKIVPGSTVHYSGVVQNTGTAPIYALLECNVYVDGVLIQTAYYTADGTAEMVYSPSEKKYLTESTSIAVDGTQNFNLSFTFDSSYGNDYKGKTAQMYVIAHAIQQRHLTGLEATNILLEGTSGNKETLPINYTELAYIEATGSQWFRTDFEVTSSTDNFIVETSIMWTNTSTRQLMGYSGESRGYFGIREDGKYEIAQNVYGNITASATSYDSLKVIRNKTSSVWSLYVNNTLAGAAPIDSSSGKMTVGSLYQRETYYKCYCKMKYFKIYQDGAIKYNLIPAKDADGNVGMYDTVNNKFYTSTSGTAFVAGPVAEPTQLLDSSLFAATGTKTGLTFTCDKTTGYITINGTATAGSNWNPSTQTYELLIANHKYALIGMVSDGQDTRWGLLNQNGAVDYGSGVICTMNGNLMRGWGIVWQNGATFNNFKFKPQLYDLTELYGAGKEPATIAAFKEDFPSVFNF